MSRTSHEIGWDRIYHRYGSEGLPWELGRPRRVLVELVDSVQVAPGKTLDLCCGVGTNPVYLAEKGFNVTALDISEKAVEYAKEKAHKSKVDVDFLVASFLNLPFRNVEFDFTFDFGCFHHVQEDSRLDFIEGVHRVLKPQGTLFLVCFSRKNGPAWNHFNRKQIKNIFEHYFEIEWVKHFSSIEGDGVTRYFYKVMMKRADL